MAPDVISRVRAAGGLRNTILVVVDSLVIAAATLGAYYVRFEGAAPPEFAPWKVPLALVSVVLYVLLFTVFGQYRLILRYVGVDTLVKLSAATAIGFTALLAADILLSIGDPLRPVPIGVLFIQAVLVFLGASAARMAARVLMYLRAVGAGRGRRVLIVGGGSAGSLLLREIQGRPDLDLTVVGFIDDQESLRGRTIGGAPVLGTTHALADSVERHGVEEVLVAMPSAPREAIRRILNAAADANVQTRVMPALVIGKESVTLRDLRAVDVEDLLGREPAMIDVEEVRETIAGRVVAVTGAAGSIGSELCRQLLQLGPRQLLLIEIDESRLYELWLELTRSGSEVPIMCLCDIRDSERLNALFALHKPELVLHAAAYKHVPLIELAPAEAIKTNVLGTMRIMEACRGHGTERFVLVSTDKAVAPANMMGLTKALAETVMLHEVKVSDLSVVAVRFGNVLASRGSVVPIFEEQLRRGGPLTVTHPDATRYFMTIPEAARLVLQAQAIGRSGDIFVLEMGEPIRIQDLARKMIALSGVPADIEYIGLRPGEKLHEDLVSEEESLVPSERPKIFRVDRADVRDGASYDAILLLVELAESDRMAEAGPVITALDPAFGERELS